MMADSSTIAKDEKLTSEDMNKYVSKSNELKEDLRKLRFDNVLGQLDDTSKIKKIKKELARLATNITKIKKLAK